MTENRRRPRTSPGIRLTPWLVLVWSVACLFPGLTHALQLDVRGPAGEPIPTYRWLIEQDNTVWVEPGVIVPESLSVRLHPSYMAPAAKGTQANSSTIPQDPTKRYYITVLPDSGYTLGGAQVAPGQTTVTVFCNKLPLPTAQISVLVFQDTNPLNGTPDVPQETGLAGFKIEVEEAGGRYGISGGLMMMDAFGNMIGTEYERDAFGNIVWEPDGTPRVLTLGQGFVISDANGEAAIKNLPQGKFSIHVIPPAGEGWQQTTTIEGTPIVDAWVKPNEPNRMFEFGPPLWHVSLGFVKPTHDTSVLTGGVTLSGNVESIHESAPPVLAFDPGGPFTWTTPWVALNVGPFGAAFSVDIQPCDENGNFVIRDVPPGSYQLVIFDQFLDLIINFQTVIVGDTDIALGTVPVFGWFTRIQEKVFFDRDQNGIRDCVTPMCDDPSLDEIGISDQAVNLRFRDGSLYLSQTTNANGDAFFNEVFPFTYWFVAEVDFLRYKATGATIVVDGGGPVLPDQGWTYPSRDVLTPQPQLDAGNNPIINPNTGNNLSRTEIGPVLLEGYNGFIGQTNLIEWGKINYPPGENGGIVGMAYYDVTRAESDPRYAAAEPWEPGIPRVQISLYADGDINNPPARIFPGPEDIDRNNDGFFDPADGVIDDLNGDGGPTLADVDNHPFGWNSYKYPPPNTKGPEDVDRNSNTVFNPGDALSIVTTDSWDDSQPTGCQGPALTSHGFTPDCFDGFARWNQVRPAVFDGGYAFWSHFPGGMFSGSAEEPGLPSGTYIVKADTPRSKLGQEVYQMLTEEARNVMFGDPYTPSSLLLPPVCVGDMRTVGPYYDLFPDQQISTPFAGQSRPSCDRKQVTVSGDQNAAADFYFYTEVPVAAHSQGMLLLDTAADPVPGTPTFGEKFGPPFVPISLRDWTSREIGRIYGDEFGRYNGLVYSMYTVNPPIPSGVAPNMVGICLNDPGPIVDTKPGSPTFGQSIVDPWFNPQYGRICYTLQYMPATTTYSDTPVLAIAAFAGQSANPVDCEYVSRTPRILSVAGPQGGPYVSATGQALTIRSVGTVAVPNPLYDGLGGVQPVKINRDFGFGNVAGKVYVGSVPLQINSWTNAQIAAVIPAGTATGELQVVRGDNQLASVVGVTVTVGPIAQAVHRVQPSADPTATPIQDAIDAAAPGDLLLIDPGVYQEMVILWKPLRLQGSGEGTVLNAWSTPVEKGQFWTKKIESLVNSNLVTLLPGQTLRTFTAQEQGSGILVLPKNSTVLGQGGFVSNPNARIDGFTIQFAAGGGLRVNGYAHYLEISNNRILYNSGVYGGGIRLGDPVLTTSTPGGPDYPSAQNDHVYIHHNHVSQNGLTIGVGAGISLNTGSEYYQVSRNFVCGNFSQGDCGGIGHNGLSTGGVIEFNTVVFNQSFKQGFSVQGGGIAIEGEAPLPGGNPLSPGTGTVLIYSNLIQGNIADTGDGGGIHLFQVNGRDVANNPNTPANWYTVKVFNNMIVNNVAALAGGGISLQDSTAVIMHNTIESNDSTATSGLAFTPGVTDFSTRQVAGIVSHAHSLGLAGAFGASPAVDPYREFSNPTLVNNIIRHNRSFYWQLYTDGTWGLVPDIGKGQAPFYRDLGVVGTAVPRTMDPRSCDLSNTTGYHVSNKAANPSYVRSYVNGDRKLGLTNPGTPSSMNTAAAFDEGGNFINLNFGPLSLYNPATGALFGNYHLQSTSPLKNQGDPNISAYPALTRDFDFNPRPMGAGPDIGADEVAGVNDTVIITALQYSASQRVLTVRATSSAPFRSVTLTADAIYGTQTVPLGQLAPSNQNDYRRSFKNIPAKPDRVTVRSTGGGTDTKNVPYP